MGNVCRPLNRRLLVRAVENSEANNPFRVAIALRQYLRVEQPGELALTTEDLAWHAPGIGMKTVGGKH